MAPDRPRKRRSALGTVAYLIVPGERRRRAAGHFSRAAIEAAKGVRALSTPSRSEAGEAESYNEGTGGHGDRQRIEIE